MAITGPSDFATTLREGASLEPAWGAAAFRAAF
jgi:hypothetical protein